MFLIIVGKFKLDHAVYAIAGWHTDLASFKAWLLAAGEPAVSICGNVFRLQDSHVILVSSDSKGADGFWDPNFCSPLEQLAS